MSEYKQVIIIRSDLKLPKGKMAAQAAHAAVEAVMRADKDDVKVWRGAGQKKIALKVDSEAQLYKIVQVAKDLGLTTSIITDAGKTVIAPGTVTCAGIGPNLESDIDKVTDQLKLA